MTGSTYPPLPPDAPRIGLELRLQAQSIDDGSTPARLAVNLSYYLAIRRAGGRPILLPPTGRDGLDLLDELDGVLLTGGLDVRSERYGQAPHPANDPMPAEQDASVFALLEQVDRRQLPVLGVCLGCQVMNVHRGGTLHQHLPDRFHDPAVRHSVPSQTAWHAVRVDGGRLLDLMGAPPTRVTSRHHQAVDRIGKGLQAVASAPDGVIEAVEDPQRAYFIGVQWHCEDMPDDEPTRRLFAGLVEHACQYRQRRSG